MMLDFIKDRTFPATQELSSPTSQLLKTNLAQSRFKQSLDMPPITLIFSLLLGSVLTNPIAQPVEIISERHEHHKGHAHTCPANVTLYNEDYFGVKTMIPVSASQPTVQLGSSTVAIITPNDYCTISKLVVPPEGLNKTCTLQFLIPDRKQAGFNYNFAGPGHFTFTGYAFGVGATEETTFQNQPPAGPSPLSPPSLLTPEHTYVINVGPCGIEPSMAGMEVSGMLCSPDTTFVYQQRDDRCPIVLFVTIT
jgi:hypothetical protein